MDDDAASAQLATKLAESDSKARYVLGDDDGKMGDPEEAAKMPAGPTAGPTAGPSETSEQGEQSERGRAGEASEASCKEEYGGEEKAAEGGKASKIGLLRALLTRVRKRNAKGKKRQPGAPDASATGTRGPSKPSSFMEAQEAALRRASSSSKK